MKENSAIPSLKKKSFVFDKVATQTFTGPVHAVDSVVPLACSGEEKEGWLDRDKKDLWPYFVQWKIYTGTAFAQGRT